MGLSQDLISQFAKVVNENKKQNTETILYGTVRTDANGNKYVQLDGSDQLTPMSSDNQPTLDAATITTSEGDRVTVLIKNHTATVIGNSSSPAVNNGDVDTSISNFDIAIGQQIQATRGYFKDLIADNAELNKVTAAIISVVDLIADEADIENLIAGKITVTDLIATKIDADLVVADQAIIDKLKANSANILSLIADNATIENLIANKATINSLIAEKISAKEADIKYANIDFANIGEAAIEKLFTDSGIIRDLVMSEGHITGKLVGVTITGDLIEGNTVKADKLVVLGEDGIYYKLNFEGGQFKDGEPVPTDGLHGSVIVANTITAEKINVDDLVAFDATIGGFNITKDAIYSGVKSTAVNTTRGVYLDRTGQFALGDSGNYLRYYQDQNGNYKLEIAADSIAIRSGGSNKTIDELVNEAIGDNVEDIVKEAVGEGVDEVVRESLSNIEIGARNIIRNSKTMIFKDYYFKREEIYYVSLGDSIAAGHSINENWERDYGYKSQYGENGNTYTVVVADSYTDLIGKELVNIYPGRGIYTNSYAHSGDTVVDLLNKLSNDVVIEAVSKADIVTICIGANDVLQPAMHNLEQYINTGDLSSIAATVENNLRTLNNNSSSASYYALFNRLTGLNPRAKYVFTTIYNPYKYLWIDEGQGGFFGPLLSTIPDINFNINNALGLPSWIPTWEIDIDGPIKDGLLSTPAVQLIFNRVNGLSAWAEKYVEGTSSFNGLNRVLRSKVSEYQSINPNIIVAETKALFDTYPDRQKDPSPGVLYYHDLVNVEYTRNYTTADMAWGALWSGSDAGTFWWDLAWKHTKFNNALPSLNMWDYVSFDLNGFAAELMELVVTKVIAPDVDPHPEYHGQRALKTSFMNVLDLT